MTEHKTPQHRRLQELTLAGLARLGITIVAVYTTSLSNPTRVNRKSPLNVRTELGEKATLEKIWHNPEYDLDPKLAQAALARGDLCVVTYVGKVIAAYGWVAYDQAPHTNHIWVQFGPGLRYNYKSFTLPEFRGRRIRGSYGALDTPDAARGITHSIEFISPRNTASRRAEARNGGQQIGWAGYWTLGKRTFCFASTGARCLGFRFYLRSARQSPKWENAGSE